MSEEKTKMTFIQKLDNYWYHYKWHTILGVFAMIIVIICTSQCVGKKKPDVMMLYAGTMKEVINPAKDHRDTSFESIMREDYNGDGEKKVDVIQIIIPIANIDGVTDYDDKVALTNDAERKNLEVQVTTGDAVIYLLHPHIYNDIKAKGILLPLSEIFDEVPEEAMDEHGIPVSELYAYKSTTLHSFRDNNILCIRRERTEDSNSVKPDDHEFYMNNLEFFKDLVEY